VKENQPKKFPNWPIPVSGRPPSN